MPSGKLQISSKGSSGSSDHEMNDVESSRFQVDRVNHDDGYVDDDAGNEINNQYTYIQPNDKTFGQMTREALPKLDNYRGLDSINAAFRPTMDELHNNTYHEKVSLCLNYTCIYLPDPCLFHCNVH